MHAIVFSVFDLFRSFVRGERGWPEVDATRRLEEQRDHIHARGYLSRYTCAGRPGRNGMRGVFLRSRPRRQYSGQHRALRQKRGQLSFLADKTKAKEDVLDELGSGVRVGEL